MRAARKKAGIYTARLQVSRIFDAVPDERRDIRSDHGPSLSLKSSFARLSIGDCIPAVTVQAENYLILSRQHE